MKGKFDFSGWATKNNLRCADGRVIMKDAFKGNDGQTVPLVWNHNHSDPYNVLGHALLENRAEGVYAYCTFNDTEQGRNARQLVRNGDVTSLSIYANRLQQQGTNVLHGAIREVSLVLAGANPGARIDFVELLHGEAFDDEAIISTGDDITISHADDGENSTEKEQKEMAQNTPEHEETVADVFATLNEKQKKVVYALIGQALEDAKGGSSDEEEDKEEVRHNVFDNGADEYQGDVLSHAEMTAVLTDAKRYGSLRESALAHGIEDIEYLFPDAQTMESAPGFIKRNQEWVQEVMNAVHHTPFSRLKSMFANITEDDARAKGYIKGHQKKEEVFGLLKRTTTPTTVYKKQKLDRDDVVDITDFDVVAWLKTEMRMMLDEELARAFLIGDGRLSSSDDKINEQCIRPIAFDDDLYTIKAKVELPADATGDQRAKALIRTVVRSRKNYKGSGSPTLYTTEDVLTDCLLLEDFNGRVIYDSVEKLANAMRVKKIVTVPVMEGAKGTDGGDLLGIVVNLADYNVGADKGGAVNMFDDFDIDYNAQKYLIETRCSGALTIPYSAIALEAEEVESDDDNG